MDQDLEEDKLDDEEQKLELGEKKLSTQEIKLKAMVPILPLKKIPEELK
jgi:hypothetical protein